ncbi:hypothetical protein GCM10010336_51690 [Streptomyces goshikiensis]|nr:hypothetical protein GCM10010336_51690 [Streptomyces goshikiensis]
MWAWAVDSLIPNLAAIFARVVCSRRYTKCHHRPLGRTEPAAPVALTSDNQHGDPLHERMRQVMCGRMDDQRGPPSNVIETSDISINTSGASFVALHDHHPISGQLEEAH